MKTIAIIALVVIILLTAIYMYNTQKTKSQQTRENFENGDADKKDEKTAELKFFWVEWCPHCKTAKPEWDKLKAEYTNKKINGYNVIFTDIDCTKTTAEIEKQMSIYNIEAYPTFKLIKGNQVIDFDAKPIKDTFVKFLNTVL
jgi:thiol-disulfide isomerase/thioredoxin